METMTVSTGDLVVMGHRIGQVQAIDERLVLCQVKWLDGLNEAYDLWTIVPYINPPDECN